MTAPNPEAQTPPAAAATPGDVAGDIAPAGGQRSAAATPDFVSTIPAEYKDKPYMQTIKSQGELLKQFDNLQPLIGAVKVPKSDATPEEWGKFYKTLGRPDEANGYGLNSVPEGTELPDYTKNFNESLEKTFHEAGLTKTQADKIVQAFVENSKPLSEARSAAMKEKSAAEFTAKATEILGAEKESTLEVAKNMLEAFTPDSLKERVNGMDAETKLAFAAVLKGVSDKYITEDDLSAFKGGDYVGGAVTEESLQADLHKLFASDEYKDPFNGGHKNARAKAQDISTRLTKLRSKTS